MKRAFSIGLLLMLVVAMAMPLIGADQDQKKERRKKKGKASPVATLKKRLEQVDLTEEQEKKLEEVWAKHGPELERAQEQIHNLLTADQRRARAAAMKKARDEGKKGREAREQVDAALNLTAEQKEKLEELQEKVQQLQRAMRADVIAILTPEQREKADLQRGGKRKKKR